MKSIRVLKEDIDLTPEQLLPCPFCGNSSTDTWDLQRVHIVAGERNTLGYGLTATEPYKVFYVRCGKCSARTGETTTEIDLWGRQLTEEQARRVTINRWNRRAGEVSGKG